MARREREKIAGAGRKIAVAEDGAQSLSLPDPSVQTSRCIKDSVSRCDYLSGFCNQSERPDEGLTGQIVLSDDVPSVEQLLSPPLLEHQLAHLLVFRLGRGEQVYRRVPVLVRDRLRRTGWDRVTVVMRQGQSACALSTSQPFQEAMAWFSTYPRAGIGRDRGGGRGRRP